MGRFARLRPNWLLRGWSDKPFNMLNWKSGERFFFNKTGFYVVQACDGTTNFDTLSFNAHHLGFLDNLVSRGLVEYCRPGDSIAPDQKFRAAENPYISGVHWAVTGFCNMKCRHCMMESPSGRYGEPTFQDVEYVVEQFRQANVHSVQLTGGEPFLRKDILDIIELLTRNQICVRQIYTNGTLLTHHVLDSIKSMGLFPNFQLSFDGVGAHDGMRGRADVESKATAAMQRVVAAGMPLVVATCIDRHSKELMLDTYRLMRDTGVNVWRVASPQKSGNWKDTDTALALDEEALIYEQILKEWLKDGKPLDIQLSGFFQSRTQKTLASDGVTVVSTTEPAPLSEQSPDSFDCGSCVEQPYLLPDGVLLPCCAYTATPMYDQVPNIMTMGLSAAWQSTALRSIIDRKKADVLMHNLDCASCDLFQDCGMGCRALALTETGNQVSKDPLTCLLWKNGYRRRFRAIYDDSVPGEG